MRHGAGLLIFLWFGGSLGCGLILDVDEYEVGRAVDACPPLQVPVEEGCQSIATTNDCPEGFAPADDPGLVGACVPTLPDAPCAKGELSTIGARICQSRSTTQLCQGGEYNWQANSETYLKTAIFVHADAPPGGSGERDAPVGTVAEGLARAKELGREQVFVSAGVFTESVEIDFPVAMFGACSRDTRLEASDGRPPITLGPGADGSTVAGFEITGGATGLHVHGARDVTIDLSWVHDTAGPGITFEGVFSRCETPPCPLLPDEPPIRPSTSSGTVRNVLVEDTQGAGVVAYGAEHLTLTSVEVRHVRALGHATPGYGIAAYPAAVVDPVGALGPVPRSSMAVTGSIVSDVVGAGILIEGSDATIERSAVRDVAADPEGLGRGLVVQPQLSRSNHSTLVVRDLLVERTHDVGILVHSSSALIERAAVRDTGSTGERVAGMSGSCAASGIRARFDTFVEFAGFPDAGAPPARIEGEEEPVVVRSTVVARARESGIHVEGVRARIEDSIVRDTRTDDCSSEHGDGVAVHGFPRLPASLLLRRTRVEGSARAAVAAFGAEVDVSAAVLPCNGSPLIANDGAVDLDERSSCGCEPARSCAVEDGTRPNPLAGGHGCAVDDGTCLRLCTSVWFNGRGIPDVTGRLWADDTAAPAIGDDNGCMEFSQLGPGRTLATSVWAPDHYLAYGASFLVGSEDMSGGTLRNPTEVDHNTIQNTFLLEAYDRRLVPMAAITVCPEPDGPLTLDEDSCIGQAMEGVVVEIQPARTGTCIYIGADLIPDATLSATTAGGAYFCGNVEPGPLEFRLTPPPGSAALRCRTAPLADWGAAFEGNPAVLSAVARPGVVLGLRVYCERVP